MQATVQLRAASMPGNLFRPRLLLPRLPSPAGGITRVSEALEVIEKSARLDAATAAAAARSTSDGAGSGGQHAGQDDDIVFT